MKTPRILDVMANLDEDLIESAAEYEKKPGHRFPWGAIVAGLAVVIVLGALLLPSFWTRTPAPEPTNDRYRNFTVQSAELAIVWPWQYQTVYEKYTEVTIDGTLYTSRGRSVSEDLVGDLIGTYTVVGYDNIDGSEYAEKFEVYRLKYADQSQLVAVKMDDSCYVFKKDRYEPPQTLGELFALVDLPNAIELNRFSVSYDKNNCFLMHDDDFVWQTLAECKNAPFIEDGTWVAHDREYCSFTVTSETLGVYKVAMYVTQDGYLWTNAFNYQYLYNIGKNSAEKIMQYVKENSAKTEYEPYQKSITGKIVEINEEYIVLDDSVLCVNPEDGLNYKILLNDLRISRYVEVGAIRVGENVQIIYEGEIDEANGYVIDSAVSASDVIISDGNVLIPE